MKSVDVNDATCLDFRWFYHFYLFGTLFYTVLALSTFQVYILRQELPSSIQVLLDAYAGKHRTATGKPKLQPI